VRTGNLTTKLICAAAALMLAGSATAQQAVRVERDLLGAKEIPADAYYGVQTARALENFQISGVAINHYPEFIEALALVKIATARANCDVGALSPEKRDAIEAAAREVIAGKYNDQFLVDWYKAGPGPRPT